MLGINILNPSTWSANIKQIQDIIYSGEAKKQRGKFISLELVLNQLLKSPGMTTPSIFTCIINKNLKCNNNHTSHSQFTTNIIATSSPGRHQSLEINIYEMITKKKIKTSKCKTCKTLHQSYSLQIQMPKILFITFNDITKYPHHHLNIPTTITLYNNITYNITGVTYASSIHFVHRTLHNDNILLYDGMLDNGKASMRNDTHHPFPYKYLQNDQIWNASLITYSLNNDGDFIIHGQCPTTLSIPPIRSIDVVDLTYDTPENSSDESSSGNIIQKLNTINAISNKRTNQSIGNDNNLTIKNKIIKTNHQTTIPWLQNQGSCKRKLVNTNISTVTGPMNELNQCDLFGTTAKSKINFTRDYDSDAHHKIKKNQSKLKTHNVNILRHLSILPVVHKIKKPLPNLITHNVHIFRHLSILPVLSPPAIITTDDTAQAPQLPSIASQIDISPQANHKRKFEERFIAPLPSSKSPKRPRSQCSPGTAEGESGQG